MKKTDFVRISNSIMLALMVCTLFGLILTNQKVAKAATTGACAPVLNHVPECFDQTSQYVPVAGSSAFSCSECAPFTQDGVTYTHCATYQDWVLYCYPVSGRYEVGREKRKISTSAGASHCRNGHCCDIGSSCY